MRPDDAALVDAVRAAELAIDFLGNASPEELGRELKTQSAVLHQLLVLGEAVKRISTGFREAHPGVPWRRVAGMRDVLIHAYDVVDIAAVHATVSKDLPALVGRSAPSRHDRPARAEPTSQSCPRPAAWWTA